MGIAGTYTFVASGIPAPTLSETGALPAALAFTNNGNGTATLSGTPAAGTAGAFPFTITASNGVGTAATQNFMLTVNQAAAITSANSTTLTIGTPGSFSVTATGSPAPTLSESGILPSGITFNPATGLLSGTPTASGAFPITFTAHNGAGTDATQNFTLTVNQSAAITSGNSATMTVGVAASFPVTATGFPAPTLSETGALPNGILFNAGSLAGTPVAGTAGTYPITITAHNGAGADAMQNFTLTVNQAAAITSANTASFVVGSQSSFTVTATGSPAPTLSMSGALPSGISFTAATGVLAGTPAAGTTGTYPITFTAHNGVGADATQNFTLVVPQAAAITSPTSPTVVTFVVGTAGTFPVTATGAPMPALSETGALPSTVTFVDNKNGTGTLSGTPAPGTVGSYPITITAHNGVGADATQSLTLAVTKGTATVTLGSLTQTYDGTAKSASATTVPAGLTVTFSYSGSGGTVYGPSATAPVGAGTYTVTGTVSDSNYSGSGTGTLTIGKATPAVTWATPAAITYGTALGATQLDAAATGAGGTALPGTIVYTPPTGTVVAAGSQTLSVTFTPTDTTDYSTASKTVTMTVNQAASITSASSSTFTIGAAGSFTVTATGFPSPTLSEVGALPNGVHFTAGTLAGTPAAGTTGTYPITITAHNGVGADATQSFLLTVNQAPAITSANAATFDIGAVDSFTLTASGSPAPSLGESGALPSGVTFNASTGELSGTPAAGTAGTYSITFAASNGVGSSATQNFTLTVGQGSNAPSINSPGSATFVVGFAGSFIVTATGSPTPALSESGALPTGVTFNSSTGTLSGTPAVGSLASYHITFTAANGVGTNATQNFTLAVDTVPAITTEPQNQTVSAGQTATLMVAVTGSAPLTYQWQKNGVDIGGAASSTYTTPVTTANDNGTAFTVVVSNPLGSVTSSVATLTVNTPPAITVPPANQTVAVGETGTFNVSVSVTGTLPLAYQWSKNNVSIPGATSSSYTTPAALQTDNGDQISVVVSNSLGAAPSNAATLTVSQPASPATYYVDFASGADTNSGLSKNAPWRYAPGMSGCAFNCTVFGLKPGDKVIFKGGVTWDATGFPMFVNVSGASGNPIYYGVDQTWFAGNAWSRPAFDLTNSTWSVAPILASSANFVTLDNLEIKNEEVDNSGSWPPRSSITVDGGSNITIQNCYIHGWSIQQPLSGSDTYPTGGIAFYNQSAAGAVQNCVLDGSPESDSGIGIYGGTSIQGNIIENVPNGIVVTDATANVSGNQVFDVPYSVDPSISSYSIFASNSGSIYNNIVHDLAPGAFALFLEAGASETGNTQYVYNNFVWNVSDTAPIVISSGLLGPNSPSNQFIYNNTLSGGATAGCMSVNPNVFPPTNLTVQNNHCISDQPASQAWCWNQAGGSFECGPVTNLTFGNNVLMTSQIAASGGYTLTDSYQPTAPNSATAGVGLNLVSNCVTVGSSLCSDRLGAVRPGGSTAWDAGAYQYQSVAGGIAPIITQQPVHQEVTSGQTATLSVIAAGSAPLNYQWQQNGTAISGATSSTYISPATTVDGTLFTVVVSNAVGSVTSSPALLSVSAAPGQLTPNPGTGLNFGTVSVGTASPASVTLTNTSTDYLTISNVSIAGPGFSASGVPSGIILSPGEAATLNVVFAPSGTGPVTGSVTVSSDAVGSPTTIPLSGTGINAPHSVNLSWNPDTSSVFGYYLYRATNLYGPYTRLDSTPVTATLFTDFTVVPGQTYLYWLTAVASDTVESAFSDPVTVVVPTP